MDYRDYEPEYEPGAAEPEESRDYCAEAHSIAMGEIMLLAERAHIVALREEIDWFESVIRDLKRQNEMLRASHPAFAATRKPSDAIRLSPEYISASIDVHMSPDYLKSKKEVA